MSMFPWEDRAKVLMQDLEMFRSMRHTQDNSFNEIQQLLWPFRDELNTESIHDGFDRVLPVYDSTGMISLHNLVNFIKGRLFPPNFPWLKFGAPTDMPADLARQVEVKWAYQQTANRLLRMLDDSNFYVSATDSIRDGVALGNMCSAVEEKSAKLGSGSGFRGYRFDSIDISRVWWVFDQDDTPDRVYVKYNRTARGVWDAFGNPGPVIDAKIQAGKSQERFDIWHVVFLNENDMPNGIKVDSNRTWASMWIEPSSKFILREGGFNEHPYDINRWNVIGKEWYGNGLGNLIRPDVAGINSGRAMLLEAIEGELLPPLLVEHDSVMMYDQADASTMSVRSTKDGVQPSFLRSGANIGVVDAIFRQDREQIRAVMLGDLVGDSNTQPRSAQETMAIQARSVQRSSTLTEFINAWLHGVVKHCLTMGLRRNAFPELKELAEETGYDAVDVQFTSPLFTLQKANTIQNAAAFTGTAVELMKVAPEIKDRINFDSYIMMLADLFDVPAEMMVSDTEYQLKRIAAVRQQKALMQAGQPPGPAGAPRLPQPEIAQPEIAI